MTNICKQGVDYLRDSIVQTFVLFIKNKILLVRRWTSTAVILLSPIIIIFLLWLLGILIEVSISSYTQVGAKPLRLESNTLSKCVSFNKLPCYTLAYTTNNSTMGNNVMKYVISNYLSSPSDSISFETTEALTEFLRLNPNKTLTAVSFSNVTSTAPLFPASRNYTNIAYTLYYNSTSGGFSTALSASLNSGDVAPQLLDWQVIIDNAILYFRGKELGFPIPEKVIKNVYQKGFPKVPNRPNGQLSILSVTGPQFFSLCMMIILVVCMYSIVLEKELKLRFGMVMMGLRNSAYWISWFLTFTLVAFVQTLITIGVGAAFQIYVFLYTDFFALFVTFFIFSLCCICIAFLLSSFVATSKTALIFGFVLLAFSYILNLVVANSFIIPSLYNAGVTPAIPVLLHLYPPYNFAKVFADMLTKTSPTFDALTGQYAYNNRYYFSDLFVWSGTDKQVPPSALALAILIAQGVLILIAAWYLDNVFASSSGYSRGFFFCLSPSYWGCNIFKTKISKSSYVLSEEELSKMDPDIRKEYDAARNPDLKPAIRITGLQKKYQTLWGRITGKIVHAVRGLDMIIPEGTCMALLGHNGAGKTTTISIMQGWLQASSGDVEIFGTSVHDDIDHIRRNLGVCPQHDILWPDLTAREHLLLFSILKQIPFSELWNEVNLRLKDVGLFKVGNNVAGSYSGGMKRRLSVAISCIANPQVILMDEPTTGMDPFNRRQVWDLMARMKKNRVILLTTHSMEEADALADRIGIMAYGKLQCVGDSIHLKHKYGTGYNLNLTLDVAYEQQVDSVIRQSCPQAILISSNAGNVLYGVPQQFIEEMAHLIEYIEKWEEQPNCPIREWSISHTTLEEVYLKVTSKSEFGFSEVKHNEPQQQTQFVQAIPQQQEGTVVAQGDQIPAPLQASSADDAKQQVQQESVVPPPIEPVVHQPPVADFMSPQMNQVQPAETLVSQQSPQN